MKLYITGNGFDLHHGLDTSYFSFGIFLQLHHKQSYDNLVEFVGFTNLPKDKLKLDEKEHPLWSEFERNLAGLDSQSVLDAFEDSLPNLGDPNFRDREWHTFEIEIQGVRKSLTDVLFKAFELFISQVKYPMLGIDKKLQISNDAFFINFNYTKTIEHYYGIRNNQILYIHGNASLPGEKLILGHGVDPKNFEDEPVVPPTGLTYEELEQWRDEMGRNYNYAYESGKYELNRYFTNSFKNTDKVISENKAFLSQLNTVNEVIIVGHSLSEIDMPYFAAIKQHIQPDSTWTATWHNESDREKHFNALQSIGIENPHIIQDCTLLVHPGCNS
ncbi:bacteriophage abortive infection AbiH family protein [Klebsiella michiganensis]|nr:bacteriophage abortive infection AbiH family protein [Klebsiella michiganensis]